MMKQVVIAICIAAFALGAATPEASAKSTSAVAVGANQRASVEGCMGQTLFDGFWRFKVTSLTSTQETSPGLSIPAWAVTMEIRNARPQDSMPSLLGVERPELILQDGTVLQLSVGSNLSYSEDLQFKELPPGGAAHSKVYFRIDNNAARPTKLLLGVNSTADGPKGVGYPMHDPSFRVRLDCKLK